jgi:hypothetical protein
MLAAFEAVQVGEFGQGPVDLPLQHRRAGHRAAESRALAIDQADLVAE